jgi:type I restriction enzyme S subunit
MKLEKITLGELCEFKYGESLPEAKRSPGDVPVYGSNGIVGYHNASVTKSETLIIGRKGSIGKVHYSNKECFPIDTTYYVSETKRECHLKWLYYVLNSLRLTELNKSSAVPGLNRNDAYERTIYLPPLLIQQQIAAILEKADAAREKRRQANQLTEQFLQSAFLEMFGDPATNPKGWEKKAFGDCIESIRYATGSPQPYVDQGIPFIRATNIKGGTIVSNELKFISFDDAATIMKCKVKSGDLILVRSGVNAGDCAIIPQEFDGAYAAYDLIIELNKFSAIFFNHLINSGFGKRLLEPLKRRAGQPHLNADQIKSLIFPLPPLSEQQKFAALVEKVESLRAKQRQSEHELEHLFHSLMQRAFRGELVGE